MLFLRSRLRRSAPSIVRTRLAAGAHWMAAGWFGDLQVCTWCQRPPKLFLAYTCSRRCPSWLVRWLACPTVKVQHNLAGVSAGLRMAAKAVAHITQCRRLSSYCQHHFTAPASSAAGPATWSPLSCSLSCRTRSSPSCDAACTPCTRPAACARSPSRTAGSLRLLTTLWAP